MGTQRKTAVKSGRTALLDELMEAIKGTGKLTATDIARLTEKLSAAKRDAQKKQPPRQETSVRPQEKPAPADHIQQVTSMDLPMDWENLFTGDSRAEGVCAQSIPDGLILSLSNLGRVDIEYISSITGADLKTVICTLKGSIYQNPDTWEECFYKGWETAEEYLSGNMVQKWKAAKEADKKYRGYFTDNVSAIEKVLPPTLSAEDIYITLGSPWVPEEVIDDFIRHILRLKDSYRYTTHDTYTGSWEIDCKSLYSHRVAAKSTYGTEKMKPCVSPTRSPVRPPSPARSGSSTRRIPLPSWKSRKSSLTNFKNGCGRTRSGRLSWR